MARSHREHTCPFIRTGLFYPPEPEDHYAFGDDAVRDLAFRELSEALEAVDDPLAAAAASLTVGELTTALQALPVARRADVLRPLGLTLSPVKVGRTLAQNALTLLKRANDHDRRHACYALTYPLGNRILIAALASGGPDRGDVAKRLSGLSPAILRLTVWSNGQASALGARVWVWASQQPWFVPNGVDTASTDRVAAAAQALIDATPELQADVDAAAGDTPDPDDDTGTRQTDTTSESGTSQTDSGDNGDGGDSGDSDRGPVSAEGSGAKNDALDDRVLREGVLHEGVTHEDAAPTSGDLSDPDLNSGSDPVQSLTQGLSVLEGQAAAATRAAEGVAEDVTAGRPPQPDQLELLAAFAATFAAVSVTFAAVGVDVGDVSVDSFREALETYRLQSGERPLRADLARLGTLTAPPAQQLLREQLAVVATRAADLLHAPAWTPVDRSEAQSLALLVSLTDPDVDLATKMRVQQQVAEANPALAFLAIQAGTLVVPDFTDARDTGATDADATDATGTTDVTDTDAATEQRPGLNRSDLARTSDEPPDPQASRDPGPARLLKSDDQVRIDGPVVPQTASVATGPTPTTQSAVDSAGQADDASASTANSSGTQGAADHAGDPDPEDTVAAAVPDSSHRAGADPATPDLTDPAPTDPASTDPGPADPGLTDATLPGADPASVRDVLAALVGDRRYALAAEFARACETSSPDPSVLTTSALAAAVRTPNGAASAAIKSQLQSLDGAALTDTSSLLLLVPALLRVALVTGDYAAGALLIEAEPHLEQHLGTLAHEVGKRAVEGALVHSPPLTWVTDTASTEQAITASAAEALHQTRDRTLRYKRASDIANDWLREDGLIGRALRVVAADARAERAVVAEALTLLSDPSAVGRQIEIDDRRRRASSSKSLQGPAVGNLMSIATEALNPLSRWTAAIEAEERSDRRTSWSSAEVAQMRTAIQAAAPAALEALTVTAKDHDSVVAAAAAAGAASLEETVSLLAGGGTGDAIELSVSNVLGLDLLHLAGVHVDESSGDISLPAGLDADAFPAAAARSWEDSARVHIVEENFPAARRIVRAAQSQLLTGPDGAPALSAEVIDLVSVREDSATADVNRLRSDLEGALRSARLNNQISEEQDAELTAQLRSAERETSDPGAVRIVLDGIAQKLPHYQQEAAGRLRDKLSSAHADGRASDDEVARVTGFIDHGDLGTAEELIYLLQNNESLPSMRPHDELQHFFPVVPDALPHGITSTLIKAVRDRQSVSSCPVLDYSGVSSNVAELTVAALKDWVKLSETPMDKRWQVSAYDLLPPLQLAGIELKKFDPDATLTKYRDRRFVDFRDVTWNGKAMVPAFGSDAGDRRRLLLVWGQPSAETLMSYVDQDPAKGPLIVAYFGTMTVQARKELAVRSLQSSAPVVVLDDAALAYLAARGRRLFESTMRILLPFAHVNPYIRQKRGAVAAEMFYGRGDERRSVLDKNGTQIIYGGRGLGKSALLHDAEADFEKAAHAGNSVAIYMSLDSLGIGVGGGALGAGVIWDALLQQLLDREVVAPKKAPRGSRLGAYDKVQAQVTGWLGEDPSRRLLILLDESDRFFEVDAPVFLETKRFRELGLRTQDRAKVVFAGLHSVQRFTKIAGNSPFSHLAQRPTVIGPLKPQHALNLLTAPLEAMGYTFEEPDLVNRVLANCSYQPFLLQMFGHHLVERLHRQRKVAAPGVAGVPYVITRADIEAVETNNELREDISNAFRETLHLDPRYNVIANVMARHAHNFGLDARLSDTEMREECLEWWRDGFASLDVEAFRAYLAEMVGLGVLARNSDGGGWRLRGPAVLNMVGLPSEVETQLLGADTSSLREEFVALETRTLMGNGQTRSPLTVAQMDDLIGDHTNQVRVVLGSEATGIGAAADAVVAAADIGERFEILTPGTRGSFEAALVGGKPGERRVVVSSLVGLDEDKCLMSLEAALTRLPDKGGVTRSTVLVADADQLGFWREVLRREGSIPELSTVSLRRYDLATLRVWALVSNMFGSSPERTARLLESTGGWPFLVERAAARRASSASSASSAGEVKVLDSIRTSLGTPAGAAELVAAVGVESDACAAAVYNDLVEMLGDDEDASLADLQSVAGDSSGDPDTVVACLPSLGVLTPTSSGRYRLEPVLAAAWRRR